MYPRPPGVLPGLGFGRGNAENPPPVRDAPVKRRCLHCQPTHQQSHRLLDTLRAWTDTATTLCTRCAASTTWPGTLLDSCSPLSLDRLRRTAVIAAEDVDRADFSDPALNADLDKSKMLLPHPDLEPSSMMMQPVGESEPTRKNSAAV